MLSPFFHVLAVARGIAGQERSSLRNVDHAVASEAYAASVFM